MLLPRRQFLSTAGVLLADALRLTRVLPVRKELPVLVIAVGHAGQKIGRSLQRSGYVARYRFWPDLGRVRWLPNQPYRVALVAGVGGRTGSEFVCKVSHELTIRGRPFVVACTAPFAFEDVRRKLRAQAVFASLAALDAPVSVLRMEQLLPQFKKGIRFDEALRVADHVVMGFVREYWN